MLQMSSGKWKLISEWLLKGFLPTLLHLCVDVISPDIQYLTQNFLKYFQKCKSGWKKVIQDGRSFYYPPHRFNHFYDDAAVGFILSASCFLLVIFSTNLQSHLLDTLSPVAFHVICTPFSSSLSVTIPPSLRPSLLYLILIRSCSLSPNTQPVWAAAQAYDAVKCQVPLGRRD